MIVHGKIDLSFNGTEDTFEIPHTMGSLPDDVSVTLMAITDENLTQRIITFDATAITIQFETPPLAGSMQVCWQAFKD